MRRRYKVQKQKSKIKKKSARRHVLGVVFMPEGFKLHGDTGTTTDQGDTLKTDMVRHTKN